MIKKSQQANRFSLSEEEQNGEMIKRLEAKLF